MVTKLKTVHEEEYSDNTFTIGVLLNYSDAGDFKESLIYVFNNKTKIYIFFDTIIDAVDYLMWGQLCVVNRAYMEENDFDEYYDNAINGKFSAVLAWGSK